MHKDDFRLPIRIIERPGEPVREIYSAGEALDFLLAWSGKATSLHEAAIESCFAVLADLEAVDAAQDAFRRFARVSGILSIDMMPYLARRGRARSTWR